MLFSTHITSDIEKCADDILYIRDGKLVANCSMDDFRKNCCGDGESLEEAHSAHGKGCQGMIKLLRKRDTTGGIASFLLLHRV